MIRADCNREVEGWLGGAPLFRKHARVGRQSDVARHHARSLVVARYTGALFWHLTCFSDFALAVSKLEYMLHARSTSYILHVYTAVF